MDKGLTIDEMFEGLMSGKQYVLKETLRRDWAGFQDGTLRYFVPGGFDEIHKEHSYDGTGKDYFCYDHYGSSAMTAERDNLEWILEAVFKTGTEDFTELNHHTILDVINEGR